MEEAETVAPRPRRANELGPIGAHVAENVKRLRESLPLTTEQLAERVTKLGRPMRGNTITKIEKGQRRVDVDDMVALAIALESRPDALLLPPTIAGEVQLAESKTVTLYTAWMWANGRRALEVPEGDDGTTFNMFMIRSQPVGLREYRPMKPEEYGPGIYGEDGKFHPMPEGGTSGEHQEAPER